MTAARDGIQSGGYRRAMILRYLRSCQGRGYAPTVREIGAEVGLSSSSTVYGHLAWLRDSGQIRSNPDQPRTWRVA